MVHKTAINIIHKAFVTIAVGLWHHAELASVLKSSHGYLRVQMHLTQIF